MADTNSIRIMKSRNKLILKSLTDLPADAFPSAASAPGGAARVAGPAVVSPETGPGLRSMEFLSPLTARGLASLPALEPWPRGGLNE